MTDPKTEDEEKNDKGKNDFRWVDENLKMARLYVIPVQKDANGKREPRKLTTENYQVDEFDWSGDGSRIAFSHSKSPGANDWTTADVSIVEVASGKVQCSRTRRPRKTRRSIRRMASRSQSRVSDNPPRWAQSGVIQIFSTSGGQPKSLVGFVRRSAGHRRMVRRQQAHLLQRSKGTGTQIYVIDVAANRIEEIKSTAAVLSANQSSIAPARRSALCAKLPTRPRTSSCRR